MSKKFNIIKDAADLEKKSLSLTKKQENLDGEYHEYLISEIWHIEKHRNPTRLNRFFSRLAAQNNNKGAGVRINAMHQFIQTFANVRLLPSGKVEDAGTRQYETKLLKDKDPSAEHTVYYVVKKERSTLSYFMKRKEGKAVYSDAIQNDDNGLESFLKLAWTKPWWTFRPEREPTPFKFDKVKDQIHTTIKRVFDAAADARSFDAFPSELMADLLPVFKKHGVKVDDLTEKFANLTDVKIPTEISNVVPFPKPKVQEEEKADPNKTPAKKRG